MFSKEKSPGPPVLLFSCFLLCPCMTTVHDATVAGNAVCIERLRRARGGAISDRGGRGGTSPTYKKSQVTESFRSNTEPRRHGDI